jgi:CRISPR-associated protein Cas1
MALHALAYCRRLFYLEEVEEIRVADDRVYAGRTLHTALAAIEEDASGERTSLELSSPTLGLFGKVDCVKRRDGEYLPYEHKRGRCRRGESGPEAWPSDRLQVLAYAAMLEETLGRAVPEGRVRYHADNVTVKVPFDEQGRADLQAAIAEARSLRSSIERPPITDNERLCQRCSLAPVCLPEEGRLLDDSESESTDFQDAAAETRAPVRLFPADYDRATLHIVSSTASVGISGDTIVVRPREGDPSKHPVRGVDTLVVEGQVQVSTQALRCCARHGVGVHWLSAAGTHLASLVPTAGQVQRRVRQYRALSDETTCVRLAKCLAAAKVESQHRYLLRTTRSDADARARIFENLKGISQRLDAIAHCDSRDALRGHEGLAAVDYFAALRQVLSDRVPDELRTDSRSRRPPLDRFNALLSYGYGLLHTAVMRGILASGLEPALGFFHTPRSAAYPLVLDLMELFRVTLWDLVLVGSLNRGQWDAESDFVVTRAKVWLSEAGRRKAIGLFESRLDESWKHPVLAYSLTYRRTIELEARLLEKEWSGEPGLFARSRLR